MHDTIRLRLPVCLAALALASGCAGGGSTAGSAAGPATVLYVEVTVVNDFSRYQALGGETERNTEALVNLVNSYFAQSSEFMRYTPQIILLGQRTITSAEADPMKDAAGYTAGDLNFQDALELFAAYRFKELGSPRYANDAAILLTHRPASGGDISLAYTWQMCSPNASAAVVQVNYTPAFDASSIAHALGHLLGMCHDPPAKRASGNPGCRALAEEELGSTCASRIMSASSNPSMVNDRFSRCSAADLNDFVDNRLGTPNCLMTPAPGVAMGAVEVLKPER